MHERSNNKIGPIMSPDPGSTGGAQPGYTTMHTTLPSSEKKAKFQPHSCITFPLKPRDSIHQNLEYFKNNAHWVQ